MKKILAIFLFLLIAFCGPAQALEIVRQKNVATRIVFPIVDADGDTVTGAAGLDSEIDEFADGSNPTGFADCTNEATEIGTSGVYYLNLTATEINQDYVVVQVKTTTSGAKTQIILIRTLVGDPLNLATTTSGREVLTASGGQVAPDFSAINGTLDAAEIGTDAIGADELAADAIGASEIATDAITAAEIAADAIGSSELATDAIGASEIAASAIGSSEAPNLDAAVSSRLASASITLSAGAVTVGTNNDKTGYSLTALESGVLHNGTAQAGAAGTITLAAGASATTDLYKGQIVKIYGGTGAGQSRTITAYDGSTKVATVAWNWTTNPDSTSAYAVLATASPSVNSSLQVATTASDPWATALPGSYGAGTAGKIIGDNLNATVSSRASQTSVDTIDDFVDTEVAAIKTKTDQLTFTTANKVDSRTFINDDKTGYQLSAAGVDDIWDEAQSGHATAGTFGKYLDETISGIDDNPWDNGTRTLTAFSFGVDLSAGAVDSIWDEAQSGHTTAGTFGKFLDEAISDLDDNPWDNTTRTITGGTITTNNDKSGYSLTAAQEDTVVDKVWDEVRSGHTTSGTFGQGMASVQGNVTGSVNSVTSGVTVSVNNDKTGYALTSVQEDSIVDKIWDEAISGHLTSGTTGNKLNAAGNAGDPWSITLPGSYTGSQAGKVLSNINDATDGDKEGADYTGIERTIRQQR
ncbi:MAG: hypothetical protein JNN05_01175 [Candidatus Omnitrophica bacterium]|nr:hypothetical protein [Candidatus Omnitrophota bacterium]